MTNNPQIPVPEKVTVPAPEMQKRDGIFLLIALFGCLLAANGFYVGGLRLGFAVAACILLFTALLYLRKKAHVTPLCILSLSSAVTVLVSFGIHEVTAFAPFKLLFLLLAISVFAVSAYGTRAPSLDDFRALLSPFYLFIGGSCAGIGTTAKSLAANGSGRMKKIAKILLALGISLPLLGVLTVLLVFADRAFEAFIDSIDLDFGEVFYTLFFGSLTVLFLIPLLFVIAKDRVRLTASKRRPYLSVLEALPVNTVLIAVSLLYLVYLGTQLSYCIGGFAGLLPEDYTYADYARRGFFEICVISAINLCILLAVQFFVRRDEQKTPPLGTRLLSAFISVFSMFLIASAIAKMLLYIRTYGLTFLRLGTSLFMLLLFVIFAAMILGSFVRGFKTMRVILASACILMAVTAAIEPYTVIANYNLYAYESGMHDAYELDTRYLASSCGDYGVRALVTLADDENEDVARRAKDRLENMHNRYYYHESDLDLREMTLVRYRARKVLADYYAE